MFVVEGINVTEKKVIFKIIKVHDVMKNKPLNEAFKTSGAMSYSQGWIFSHTNTKNTH